MMQTNGTPATFRQPQLLVSDFLFPAHAAEAVVQSDSNEGNRDVLLDLGEPNWHDAKGAYDQRAHRLPVQHQHERDEGLPGTHAHNQEQAEQTSREFRDAEPEGRQLMPPREHGQALRQIGAGSFRDGRMFWENISGNRFFGESAEGCRRLKLPDRARDHPGMPFSGGICPGMQAPVPAGAGNPAAQ